MSFRRRKLANLINSDKHEFTWSDLITDYGSTVSKVIVDPVLAPDANTAAEVTIGSTVTGIYIETNLSREVLTTTGVFHWKVEMIRTGETLVPPNLYYQINRSQTLKRGMEMLPKDIGVVTKRIFYVRIPKGWQRMKANNRIVIRAISTNTNTLNFCGFAIFKEYK